MFAARYPKRVKKLILLSTNPGIDDTERRKRALWEDRWLKTMERADFIDEWYGQPLFDSLRRSAHFPALLKNRRNVDLVKSARLFECYRLSTQPNLWDHLPDLPVTFLMGEIDKKYLMIYNRLSSMGVKCHLVEGGHAFHLENPGKWENFYEGEFIS